MNVIIVDDEPLAQDVLETYIEKLPDLTLVAKCNNAIEANDTIADGDIDLMFLDIQMPQLTGIEFLKTLQNPPLVIFTTAFSNYAIEGFELEAVDYLLKPISFERFMKAVNRAKELHKMQTGIQANSKDDQEFIFVKADKKLIKINFDDVLYVEGLKDYVIIKMPGNRVITLQTMKSLEAKLPSDKFKRIHRSYIVGLNQINAVIGNMVEIKDKGEVKHLPIGKNYREDLLALINKNKL